MRVKLKDVCIAITDGSHYSPIGIDKGYPMLSVKDMDEYGFNYSNCKYISKKDYEILIKNGCKPMKNDVLISKDGSYLKEVFVVEKEKEEVILSSIAILRPNLDIINPYYLAYYLKIDYIKEIVFTKYVTGSVLKRIILKNFENIEIDLPNKDIQDKIVNILSNIDNQIKRNNTIIKKLQEMILTRYSVDFEHIERMNGKLKDICTLPSGFSFKPEMYVDDGTYKLITIKNVYDTFVDTTKVDKLNAVPTEMKDFCKLHSGDILMSLTGNVGRISIVVENNNLLNQRVSLIKCEDVYKTYLYALLNSKKYQIIMNKLTRGTSQKNLSPLDVESLDIYIPTDITDFNTKTFPLFQEMVNIQKQTNLLTQLKSKLLPLLINGQLEV